MESLRHRPRVSRETRLLLATVCIASVALWVLARVRALESGVPPSNPAPALLSPLVGDSHDQLNADLARLDARVAPWLSTLVVDTGDGTASVLGSVPAIRVRDDLAIAVAPAGSTVRPEPGTELVGSDRPTGLTVVRSTNVPRPPALPVWSGPPPRNARYLMAAESTPAGVTVRPFLARGVFDKVVRGWREPLWGLPSGIGVTAGTALFTTNAEFVGIVVNDQGAVALAPAQTVLDELDRLLARSNRASGDLRVEVEPITKDVGALAGVESGLIVTWVDPSGPSASALHAGDVIQQIDGQHVSSADDWLLATARILEGDDVRIRVVRAGAAQEARVMAAPMPAPAPSPRQASKELVRTRAVLGLDLQRETGQGVAVLGVAAGSRAEEAGLLVGDIITRAGSVNAPTAAQVRQAFAKGPVLLAVTRGARHHVLALQP